MAAPPIFSRSANFTISYESFKSFPFSLPHAYDASNDKYKEEG